MTKSIELPPLPDHLSDWHPVALHVPPEMMDWLLSEELGQLIANDIGSNTIDDVAGRILHLLDMSSYQRSQAKPEETEDEIPF